MSSIGLIGIFVGLALLMFLSYKGWSSILVSLLCSVIVLLTAGIGVWAGISGEWATGMKNYVGAYFIMMIMGALFGRIMTESGAAQKVALACLKVFGKNNADLVVIVTGIVLSYAGVNVLVVLFVMYPIQLALCRERNMPKQVLCTAYSIGTGTFMVTGAPGSPSVPNLAGATFFETSAYSPVLFSIVICVIELAVSLVYIRWLQKHYRKKGMGYVPGPGDETITLTDKDLPSTFRAFLPLIVAIVLMIVFNQLMSALASVSLALPIASVVGMLVAPKRFSNIMKTVTSGFGDAFMPVFSTAAVVGFGSVVQATDAFQSFLSWCTNLPFGTYVNAVLSANLISGIVGSSSGGYQIWLNTMGDIFKHIPGINIDVLFRLTCNATTCFDTLPHSGAVVALLVVNKLSFKEQYWNTFAVACAVPIIGTIAGLLLLPLFV